MLRCFIKKRRTYSQDAKQKTQTHAVEDKTCSKSCDPVSEHHMFSWQKEGGQKARDSWNELFVALVSCSQWPSEAIFGKQPCKSKGLPLSSLASFPHTQIHPVSGGVGEMLERVEHFPIPNPNLGRTQNSTLRAVSAPSASVHPTCRCCTLVMSLNHTDTHCI